MLLNVLIKRLNSLCVSISLRVEPDILLNTLPAALSSFVKAAVSLPVSVAVPDRSGKVASTIHTFFVFFKPDVMVAPYVGVIVSNVPPSYDVCHTTPILAACTSLARGVLRGTE